MTWPALVVKFSNEFLALVRLIDVSSGCRTEYIA